MATVHVNFDRTVGRIKPMHAVGQPPFTGGFCKLDFTPMQILADAHIPYSRLHNRRKAVNRWRLGASYKNRYI